MIFVYCETCGLRIPNEDVEAKKATQLEDNRWVCAKCGVAPAPVQVVEPAPAASARPNSESKRTLTPQVGSIVTTPDSKRRNTPAGGITAVTSAATSSSRGAAPQKKPFPLIPVAGGAAVLLTVVAMFFALSSSQEQPVAATKTSFTPPAKPTDSIPKDERPSPVTAQAAEPLQAAREISEQQATLANANALPQAAQTEASGKFNEELEKLRNDRAQAMLDEAAAYGEHRPADVKGLRKKLEAVVRSYRTTPAGEEALKKLTDTQPATVNHAPLDETAFATALNAFQYVDLKEDKTAGDWCWENNALKIANGRFMLAYDPGGEYDVRFSFTRVKGGSSFGAILRPDNGKQFLFVIFPDDRVGFSKIAGKSASENASTVHLSSPLAPNTKHTAVVQIRKKSVTAYIDGQFATQYETDFSDLAATADHALKNSKVLGLYSDSAVALIHSFEIAEISGNGKFVHAAVAKTDAPASGAAPATPAQPVANVPAASVAVPEAPKPVDPAAALKSEASTYELLVWPAFALAAKDGVAPAKARLETARKDPAMASHAAALDLDLQIVASLEKLDQAALKGVDVLADKRTFKFDRVDGKTTNVGKGFKLNVKGVKNGKLILEERVGGASAESQLDMEVLTLSSRMELARLGIGSDPEGAGSLAAGLLLASLLPNSPVTDSLITAQCDAATRLKAPAELIDHIRSRQAALVREREAEKILSEAREAFEAKKNDDAKTRLASFLGAAVDTATGERAQEEVRNMLTELKARELKPGLWFVYFTGNKDGIFQKRLLARAEQKIKIPGAIPKDVPKDFWGIRAGGVLRVDTPGSYVFQVSVDDHITFSVNDLKLPEIRNKMNATISATLKTGDNAIRFSFDQYAQSYLLSVKWKPPGAADFTEIPDNVLWYDPGKVSAYEQGL